MNQKRPLVIKQSRITVLIALFICLLLLGVGLLSLRGKFHFVAVGFIFLIASITLFVIWSGSFFTIISSTGIQGGSFGTRWRYSWEQVESWGLEYSSNGEYSIWFKSQDAKKRRYIQALGEDQAEDVKACFEEYFGKPILDAYGC
jgi:energy-coupling factor transporter transmembrane protein EcfT